MMECLEYRILRTEYLYPILLKLNDQDKFDDIELFVQMYTTKHCHFSITTANLVQKAMMKWNSK